MSRHDLIPPKIILSAIAGEKISISVVLSHYQHYINSLCIRNIYSDHQFTTKIDEDIAKQLEVKLTDAILKFKVK